MKPSEGASRPNCRATDQWNILELSRSTLESDMYTIPASWCMSAYKHAHVGARDVVVGIIPGPQPQPPVCIRIVFAFYSQLCVH